MTTLNINNSFKNLFFAYTQYLFSLRYSYSTASANYGLCDTRSIQLINEYISSTLKFRPNKSIHTQSIFGCLGYL